MDDTLNSAAAIRANECFELFSHTRPSGESCFTVFDEVGYSGMTEGENLVANQVGASAETVYVQWLNSPGHHENYMNPDFKNCGLVFAADLENEYSLVGAHLFAG
jgi:uncharacterized protein YkwD